VRLTTDHHLALRLEVNATTPPLPPYDVIAFSHILFTLYLWDTTSDCRIVFMLYSLANKHIFVFFCAGEGEYAKIQIIYK
jgi:hypothetical protein